MKKLFTLFAILLSVIAYSQAPQGFNYQATVRNSSGALIVNQNVYFRFNVMLNSQTSVPVFSETHYVPTDDLGQVHLVIGTGTATTGSFTTINWGNGSYFLSIELNTGSGYVAMGTTQLLSVPYALYANSSGSSNIANGTSIGEMLFWNGTQWAINPPGLAGQVLYVNEANLPTWGFSPLLTNSRCNGSNDGKINLNLPPQISASYYTYQWTGPNNFSSTTQNISGLYPGTYQLVLTHNGVATNYSYTLTEPQELTIQASNLVMPTCYGLSTGAFTVNITQGGFENYSYSINGQDYLGNSYSNYVTNQVSTTHTFDGLLAGNYHISVTTNTGCNKQLDVVITQPVSFPIAGMYNLTATRIATGAIYDLPGEQITEVSPGTYLTSSTGPYNIRGLISAAAQLGTPSAGFKFNIVCGTNQVIVPSQGLGNGAYSNLVSQSPAQAAASSIAANGVITIEYSIWFTGNTVERQYIGVYSTQTPTQPTRLGVPGNHQGWNLANAPQLAPSAVGQTDFEGYMNLNGGYKFIAADYTGNFSWNNPNWGDNGAFTGILAAGTTAGMDCTAPAGYYKVKADTALLTYSVEPISWSIDYISPTGDIITPLTYNSVLNKWEGVVVFTTGVFCFVANNMIDYLGPGTSSGSLDYNWLNITITTPGTYLVSLDLSIPRQYTYTLTPQ